MDIVVHGSHVPATEREVQEAKALENEIYSSNLGLMARFIELGRKLYEFDSKQMWRKLGYKSFHDWAENSGKCPLGYKSAAAAKQVFHRFALRYDIPLETLIQVGQAKFQLITGPVETISEPVFKKEKEADNLFNQMEDPDLTHWDRKELRQKYLQAREEMERLMDEPVSLPGMEKPASRRDIVHKWINDAIVLPKPELKSVIDGDYKGLMTLQSGWYVVNPILRYILKKTFGIDPSEYEGDIHIMIRGRTKPDATTGKQTQDGPET
jgi:hypothetical protein